MEISTPFYYNGRYWRSWFVASTKGKQKTICMKFCVSRRCQTKRNWITLFQFFLDNSEGKIKRWRTDIRYDGYKFIFPYFLFQIKKEKNYISILPDICSPSLDFPSELSKKIWNSCDPIPFGLTSSRHNPLIHIVFLFFLSWMPTNPKISNIFHNIDMELEISISSIVLKRFRNFLHSDLKICLKFWRILSRSSCFLISISCTSYSNYIYLLILYILDISFDTCDMFPGNTWLSHIPTQSCVIPKKVFCFYMIFNFSVNIGFILISDERRQCICFYSVKFCFDI